MKKLFIVLFGLLVGFGSTFNVQAQLSKEEKKEWKAKYKAYKKDLEGFKNLVEENSELKSQLSSAKAQVSSVQSRMADKDAEIADLQTQLRAMQSEVASAKSAARAAQEAAAKTPAKGNWDQGVVFRVQIGAFEQTDMAAYGDTSEDMKVDKNEDMQKVVLGNFRDYWQADKFKKHLREMGVKDAWIVPYKDGQRVPIKDVLEGVVQ